MGGYKDVIVQQRQFDAAGFDRALDEEYMYLDRVHFFWGEEAARCVYVCECVCV